MLPGVNVNASMLSLINLVKSKVCLSLQFYLSTVCTLIFFKNGLGALDIATLSIHEGLSTPLRSESKEG